MDFAFDGVLSDANAAMAQLVERVLGKDEVTGSNPVISSIILRNLPHEKRSEANASVFFVLCESFLFVKIRLF